MNMESLFTIKSKITKEEYIRFNREVLKKEFHYSRNITIINIILGLIIVGILFSGDSTSYPPAAIIFTFLIYYNWKATKGMDRKAAKAFDLNKVNKDLETQICFFNDHYETTDEKDSSNIPYSNLYKIIETDTNLYLMYCKNQGVIIVKSNCSSDLIEFIHSIKSEYKL